MAVAVNWMGDVEIAVVVDVDGDTVTVDTRSGLTVNVVAADVMPVEEEVIAGLPAVVSL